MFCKLPSWYRGAGVVYSRLKKLAITWPLRPLSYMCYFVVNFWTVTVLLCVTNRIHRCVCLYDNYSHIMYLGKKRAMECNISLLRHTQTCKSSVMHLNEEKLVILLVRIISATCFDTSEPLSRWICMKHTSVYPQYTRNAQLMQA
jgi:hypothetical protein